MSAGKRIRQLQRYRTIATAFARNGLGYVSHEMGLTEKILFFRSEERKELQAKSVGERIRLLLEELGPTFVKLGQIASTRPDLVPADILAELERLQDKVPPFPYAEVSRILEEELGALSKACFCNSPINLWPQPRSDRFIEPAYKMEQQLWSKYSGRTFSP